MILGQTASNPCDLSGFTPSFPWQGFCFCGLVMPRTIVHVERKSRFLRALLPTYPCMEEIRFGLVDYLSIGFALAGFAGMVCVLAG
jgi:hypothetical protein